MAQGPEHSISRRKLLSMTVRGAAVVGAAGALGALVQRGSAQARMVWQLDPNLCIACGNCQTHCVLDVSAVKCVHGYDICGYCKLCSGYFEAGAANLNSGAENQNCPVGAIKRSWVEDPFYEYTIDEKLCIACGLCVKGCNGYGNGSLFLQVRHDRCLNCNQCSIAVACPAQAFKHVPADQAYLLKKREHSG
jgi:electron transport complex protein RnfB